MNLINKKDFFNLVGASECIIAEECSTNGVEDTKIFSDDEEEISEEDLLKEFSITQRNDSHKANTNENKKKILVGGRKIDYKKLNNEKHTIGELGEKIVLQMEIENLKKAGKEDLIESIIHSSKEKGDGLGYDIESIDVEGNKKLIEVKTTKSNKIDGFYISPKELKVASENSDIYYIYRLFNVNLKEGTADLRIFSGEVTRDKYNLEPIAYKVTLK